MKKAEREHVNKVAELGCVACFVQSGEWFTPGEIHHIREGQGAAQRASWLEVLCLCPGHHRVDDRKARKIAIHGNTGRRSFVVAYGTERELLALTTENL
ncbi:Ref family recombination enhancement nuclease [Buttiauxella sp. A111]|uniref:Ref family recombination enhancement nuclease n=1 Tax=Buttiauxella sp. A111 TaxID=2563088 RepID=UPI00160D8A14|nr:Ref family recombination enhancement nuclease [Buttiauxella sp. A111]